MKRRIFLEKIGKSLVAARFYPLLHSLEKSDTKRKSKNWVWLTHGTMASDDDWKRRFIKLKIDGIDAVLAEVYNARYAYFGSSRLPVKEELLERLIPIAKATGLELHTWMWVMPCLLKDIQKDHPDWYAVNRLGESAVDKPAYVNYYKFLCPAHEGVQDFIQQSVKELAQYDVQGIHLDYVRYPDVILPKGLWAKYNIVQNSELPQYDYCYCETCRNKFKSQHGIDPMTIKNPSENKEWLQFRYDQVTHLVNEKLIPAAHDSGKKISAAVFPNWKNVRQQWPVWKLDAVMPMLYNRYYLESAGWIKQFTDVGIKSLKFDTKLYSGLMVDDAELLKSYIINAFEGNARGVCLFHLGALKDEHYNMLKALLTKY